MFEHRNEQTYSMLNLQFAGLAERNRLTVGPVPWFRLTRDTIVAGHRGIVVARLRGQWWRTDGRCFAQAECRGPVAIARAEQRGATRDWFGWFGRVSIAQGEIFGDGQLVARYLADREVWRCCLTASDWPGIALEGPAGGH